MEKQDLTGYSDSELSLIVFNDECLYRQRRRRASLVETLREFFIFTDEQLQELNNDLDADEEE
jgi:hypothetical protein